jgi:hypothetical protein
MRLFSIVLVLGLALTGLLNPPPSENPFGVMLTGPMALALRIEVAQRLGAFYFRPESLFLDRWDGTCRPCDAALSAGLKLVLTVRANGGPATPTTPPSDLQAYRRTLSSVLARYRPAVIAVENEENSALFYTGTPEQYGAQLQAACEIAHQRGVPELSAPAPQQAATAMVKTTAPSSVAPTQGP